MTKPSAPVLWALLCGSIAAACGGKSGEDCAIGAGHAGGVRTATAGAEGEEAGSGAEGGSGASDAAAAGGSGTGGAQPGAEQGGTPPTDGATGGAGDPGEGGAGGSRAGSCLPRVGGLVAWWRGDGNADDAIGGAPGELGGGVAFGTGQVGQAFAFDGVDDRVDLGNAAKLRVSGGDFTLETWVRFNSHQGDMSLMDKMAAGGVNSDGWRLLKQADDRFWFCFGGGGQNGCTFDPSSSVYSTTLVLPEVWFQVAVVKTSTSFALYINGKLEDRRSPLPAFVDTSSTALLLGAYAGDGARAYLDGSIDEAKIFNRALGADEISLLFEAEKRGACTGSDDPENGSGAEAAGAAGAAGSSGCDGEGLVYLVPNECMADGGYSGIDDTLEVYCCNGTSRFCLSGESCPWRAGCTDDAATCSRGGLASDYMADAWCGEWDGRREYYCGADSQIRFAQ